MITIPDKKICLRAMQVTSEEQLLQLENIMELTVKNYGTDVILDVNSIEIPISRGEEVALPSGAGRVYGKTEVKLKKVEKQQIERLEYKHLEVNGGQWTTDFAPFEEYRNTLVAQREAKETELFELTKQLESYTSSNYFVNKQHTGCYNSNGWSNPYSIWTEMNKRFSYLGVTFNLSTLIPNVPISRNEFEVWFGDLTWDKLIAIYPHIIEGGAIHTDLVTKHALATFEQVTHNAIAYIVSKVSEIKPLVDGLNTQIQTLRQEIQSISNAITSFNKDTQVETKYYDLVHTPSGVVEEEISKEDYYASKSVNIKLLYTIEE
jgi:hypothetical protein